MKSIPELMQVLADHASIIKVLYSYVRLLNGYYEMKITVVDENAGVDENLHASFKPLSVKVSVLYILFDVMDF